jgi:hypothetical protein
MYVLITVPVRPRLWVLAYQISFCCPRLWWACGVSSQGMPMSARVACSAPFVTLCACVCQGEQSPFDQEGLLLSTRHSDEVKWPGCHRVSLPTRHTGFCHSSLSQTLMQLHRSLLRKPETVLKNFCSGPVKVVYIRPLISPALSLRPLLSCPAMDVCIQPKLRHRAPAVPQGDM